MKKRLSLLLLCLLLSVTFLFAGCDLFPRNMEAYLQRPVAKVEFDDGKTEEITTEAFISAFNSYGSSLIQNGSKNEEAIDKTMEVLINRQVMLHRAKQKVTLSDKDKKEIYNDVYDGIISNLNSFETEVEKEWKIENTETKKETEEKTFKYEEFKPKAKVVNVNDEYRIELIEEEDKTLKNFTSKADVKNAVKTLYFSTENSVSSRLKRESYRRYIEVLKANEEGMNLSTNSDEIFDRQLDKVYKSVEENKYISNLEEYYKEDGSYSTISVRQVLDKYKSLMLTSKFLYENNSEEYTKAMLDSFKDVYYAVDNNFFNVSHILIKFDEESGQKEKYDNLKAKRESGELLPTEYESELKLLLAEIKANTRDLTTGEVKDKRNLTANEVLSSLQQELNNCKTNEEKDKVFKKYIYTYNEDDGVMNAEYSYVVGTKESRMVESFTNASRDLHKDGAYGSISGLVESEYGVHIIYYMGAIENPFTVTNITQFNLQDKDIEILAKTKLNNFNNKTIFDKVFEQLEEDNYSVFENMNVNALKSKAKITRFKDVYENLIK